jgi:hypothetical protein
MSCEIWWFIKLTANVCANKKCSSNEGILCNPENGETTTRARGTSNSFFTFDFVMLCKKTLLLGFVLICFLQHYAKCNILAIMSNEPVSVLLNNFSRENGVKVNAVALIEGFKFNG